MKKARILPIEEFFPPGGFPLVVMRDKMDCGHLEEEVKPENCHTHAFSEIVVVTSGSGLHLTQQENWPVAAGDVFVIKGHQIHNFAESVGLCLTNILFMPEKLNIPKRDLQGLSGYHALFTLSRTQQARQGFQSRLRLSAKDLAALNVQIDRLETEIKSRMPGYQLMARGLFMQIVSFLSRCYEASPTAHRRDLTRIADTIAFLETNYEKEVYLDKLAAMAHMSKRNFLRVFREAMGQSPMAYLVSLRVAHAAELLREGAINVTEAGLRAGFEDSNYFARQFRSVMGMSPRQYACQAQSRLDASNVSFARRYGDE